MLNGDSALPQLVLEVCEAGEIAAFSPIHAPRRTNGTHWAIGRDVNRYRRIVTDSGPTD